MAHAPGDRQAANRVGIGPLYDELAHLGRCRKEFKDSDASEVARATARLASARLPEGSGRRSIEALNF